MRKFVSIWILMLLLTSVFKLAFNTKPAEAEWTGTVYIRADGSIDPPDAPIITQDKVIYTLTDNIKSSGNGIIVERSNVIIDGAGHTLKGAHRLAGIIISRIARANVTIKNIKVTAFSIGIDLFDTSDNVISGNDIANNEYGIYLGYSSNNVISGNNVTNNYRGIYLWHSFNNKISENILTNNGLYVEYSYDNVVENNYVNGRPLVYLEGVSDIAVRDAGQVVLVRCSRIRVESLNLSKANIGIELWKTNYTIISNNNITNNNIGIYLWYSSGNIVSRNNVENNDYGILLCRSSDNIVSGNNVENNWNGIWLLTCSNNIISKNSIANNDYGVLLGSSSNNRFFHNNFIDNVKVVLAAGYNAWDDGYPSGGNYWSNYKDVDLYHGPNQDEAGSDRIWDHPYVINPENKDRYPLVKP